MGELFERKVFTKGATPNEATVFNLAIQEFKKINKEVTETPLKNHTLGLEELYAKKDMIEKTLLAIPNVKEHEEIRGLHAKELNICEDAIKKYEDNLEKIKGANEYYNSIINELQGMVKEQVFDDHVDYTYDIKIDQTLFAKIMTLLFQIDFNEQEDK